MTTPHSSPYRQQGAVLYVALIMLLLLALIGVIGLQVAGLQERMSSDYRLTNIAFQRAEDLARLTEQDVADALYQGSGAFMADVVACNQAYIPTEWVDGLSTDQDTRTRRLDTCFPGGSSLKVGKDQQEDTGNVYQITAYSQDASAASEAAVDTVYIP